MKTYYGKYRGIVKDNADPEQLGRVKTIVPAIMGQEVQLGWAYPVFPTDLFGVPAIETPVYVEFEGGDIDRPLYTGWWAGRGDKAVEAHSHVYGEEDSNMESKKGTDSVADPEGGSVDEPEHKFEGEYPKVRSIKFPSGLVIEVDETSEDGPRMQVFHPTGAYWEMYKDGSMIQKHTSEWKVIEAESVAHIKGNKAVQINGSLRMVIDGDLIRDIGKGKVESIGKGGYVLDIDGPLTITAKDITIDGGGSSIGGVVTDQCVCTYSGAKHPQGSGKVKVSL